MSFYFNIHLFETRSGVVIKNVKGSTHNVV